MPEDIYYRYRYELFVDTAYFLMRIIGVSPTVTLPESLISSLISSMLEITTGVNVDLAFSSSRAKLNSITTSPFLTRCPSSAIRVKPSPFSSTVSIPKWTNSSMPLSDSIEKHGWSRKFYRWCRQQEQPFYCQRA